MKRAIADFGYAAEMIQTDNGSEFCNTQKTKGVHYFDALLNDLGIVHKTIRPRTPWHNGKVERSHRNDQRYFYDWEKFHSVDELNEKLREYLNRSNNKTMRTLGRKSPIQLLKETH